MEKDISLQKYYTLVDTAKDVAIYITLPKYRAIFALHHSCPKEDIDLLLDQMKDQVIKERSLLPLQQFTELTDNLYRITFPPQKED